MKKGVCCSLKAPHVHSSEGIVWLHDDGAFAGMRRAGALAAKTLNYIEDFVKPGVTTLQLNDLCDAFIRDHGAVPAPLGYKGYPKSVCTSLNQVVCHGIPDETFLKSGDILNIDVTVIVDGWHGDTSRMYEVGVVEAPSRRLIMDTRTALKEAIALVKPGVFLGDIGAFIEDFALKRGYSVVKDYCGHGIGREFHCPPSVVHFGRKGTGLKLEKGMIFTIEPMLNVGKEFTRVLSDGWTVVTKDNKRSAQFEHTLGVCEEGAEIFTQCPKSL